MTTTQEVLRLAEAELGYTERPTNKTKYNVWYGGTSFDGQPWCATFVSWVFFHAGIPLPASTSKGFAYTPSGAAWFEKQGRWYTDRPEPGDVVFFDWPGDGVNRISHVGIVKSVRGPRNVVVIEGNTQPGDSGNQSDGGAVRIRHRTSGIVGYGRPAYTAASIQPEDQFMPKLTEDQQAEMYNKINQIHAVVAASGYIEKILQTVQAHADDPNTGSGPGTVDTAKLADELRANLAAALQKIGD